ncbi:hypothetical protein TDB9533_02285 [Thalassocella blandensis]|nr:hypothetical protein TDB9533_02285 [Thalassocella blandensis]
MDQQLKSNLTSSKHWFRLLFMLFFAVCLQVAFIVMTAVVCVQFIFALITGEDNRQLRIFGDSLSQFIYQSFQFLTYNSEEKPFPFSDWPQSEVDDAEFEIVDEEEAFDSAETQIDDVEMEAAQVVADTVEEIDEADKRKKGEPEVEAER